MTLAHFPQHGYDAPIQQAEIAGVARYRVIRQAGEHSPLKQAVTSGSPAKEPRRKSAQQAQSQQGVRAMPQVVDSEFREAKAPGFYLIRGAREIRFREGAIGLHHEDYGLAEIGMHLVEGCALGVRARELFHEGDEALGHCLIDSSQLTGHTATPWR